MWTAAACSLARGTGGGDARLNTLSMGKLSDVTQTIGAMEREFSDDWEGWHRLCSMHSGEYVLVGEGQDESFQSDLWIQIS